MNFTDEGLSNMDSLGVFPCVNCYLIVICNKTSKFHRGFQPSIPVMCPKG